MVNLETQATLGTYDRGPAKQKTQHKKIKRWAPRTPPKTGGESVCARRV